MEVTTADHSEVPCVNFIMSDLELNLLSTKKLSNSFTYL